jgi:hypothetical protein
LLDKKYKKMKTKYKILLIAVLLSFGFGCSEDFFDIKPPTLIEEEYYKDEGNVYMAVIGCYDILGWDSKHNSVPYFFGDIIGRNAYKGGDIGGDQPWMDGLITFDYHPENSILNIEWENDYIAINRCNKFLENVDKMTSTPQKDLNRYVGEVKFLRAYFHFQLVRVFGEVPLVDHLLKPDEYITKKATFEELYAFIEKDFKDAIEALPTRSQVEAANEFGRVTKGAAQAMLAKAYLYQKKWQEAADLTDEIIASGEYEMLPNYADIFKLENEHNKELIFEIEFKDQLNEWGNESNGNMITIYTQARNHTVGGGAGWGFDCPTQEFADEFELGDVRKEATIIFAHDTLYKGTADEEIYDMTISGDLYATNYDKMLNKKYNLPKSQQGMYPMDQPKNWIVCRYAQVLLWNAEAKAHLGDDWQTPLNLVRARAGLPATTETDAFKAIYHEQRVELGMEGQRFWEVVRQGRGEEVFNSLNNPHIRGEFIEGIHNYFPIPKTQLDLNGGGF